MFANPNGPKLGIKPIFPKLQLVATVSKVYILLISRVSKTRFQAYKSSLKDSVFMFRSDLSWPDSMWRPPGNQVLETRFVSIKCFHRKDFHKCLEYKTQTQISHHQIQAQTSHYQPTNPSINPIIQHKSNQIHP